MSPDDWEIPLGDEPTVFDHDVEQFKWAWNKTDGLLVWRVGGPSDGQPHHETQLREAWGRPWREGDVLGSAFINPEAGDRQARVSIFAYHGRQAPPAIVRWFKDAYPRAEFR